MWCSLVGSCQQMGRVYILGIYCPFLQDLRRAIAMKLSKREWTPTVAIYTLWNRHSSQTINIVNMIKQTVSAVYNKLGVTSDFCMWNIVIQWTLLIMITLGLALFDNNNRLITLSGGYKNLHYLTQFIVTVQPFTITIELLNPSTHSKLEYRMLFPNNETGNCRTTHLSFPLSWYLDRELNYGWRLKVRNG